MSDEPEAPVEAPEETPVPVTVKKLDFIRFRELPARTPATVFLDRDTQAPWYSPQWTTELEEYVEQIVKSDPVYPVIASLAGVPFLLHLPLVTRVHMHDNLFVPTNLRIRPRIHGPALQVLPVDSSRSTATGIWAAMTSALDQPLKASCPLHCHVGRVSAEVGMDIDEPGCPTKPCPHCTKGK